MERELQFTIFVDAENISYGSLEPVFEEVLKYGVIAGKRAYADWSNAAYKNWPATLDKLGIRPFQQFHYDVDETDKAIIMDVMEVVYSNDKISGICLVGNDHIYGSVARRVRERGIFFLGIGTRNASKKFVDSCNSFIYLDNIERKSPPRSKANREVEPKIQDTEDPSKAFALVIKAFEDIDEESIHLGQLGNMLKKIDPAFDSRTYGFRKLVDLMKSFSNQLVVTPDGSFPPTYYVRRKETS